MKSQSELRSFSLLAFCALLAAPVAQAATIYWDGTAASWNAAANWSTASGAATPDPAAVPGALDDAIFNITTLNSLQSITLDAAQAAKSLTFNSTGITTLLGGGSAQTLTLGTGGMTMASGAGVVTLGDGTAANDVLISLASGAQTWTNNSAANFTFNNSAATFSRATGATLVFNKLGAGEFAVTSGVANDAAGIIGNWAFFGTGTSTQYATVSGGNIAGFSGGAATTQASWASATTNYEVNTTTTQTLGGSRTANTLRYSGTGLTIALGSGSNTLTTNGILAVGASGTLTISGTGTTSLIAGSTGEIVIAGPRDVAISAPISSGALTYSGTGRLTLTGTNTYTGNTVVSGGILRFGSTYTNTWTGTSLNANSNLEINNGIVEAYYYLTRTLGTAAGQIQFTGGRAGITNLQGDATATYLTFTNTSTTVNWGDAAFNPSTLVVNGAGASAPLRMANPFNLNGAARTVEVAATGAGSGRGAYGVFERALSGVGGSLIKTGAGTLMLDGANTYGGGTTINTGGLWFNRLTAMPASGAVTVNDGGILSVSVGGTGQWTTGASGNGTIGGLLAGLGGQVGGTVSYSGNVNLGFNVTTTQTYSGNINNVGTTLGIHIGNKDGGTGFDPFPTYGGTMILSGNNGYTGPTFINRGTLRAGSANALGSGGDITFRGGTLQYTAASAANDYGSRIKNSTGAIALDTNGQNAALSGIANTNTGGLTKSGAGILTLTGNNTYTGLTTVSGGSLVLNNDGDVTGSAISFNANSTSLTITGGTGVISSWNAGGGTLIASGDNIQMLIDGAGTAGSARMTNVGTLQWGRSATSSTIRLTNGGQMTVNGEVQIGSSYYFANSAVIGAANLTIEGGAATSTFTGNSAQVFYIGYGDREGANNNVVTVSSGGVLTGIGNMVLGQVGNAQGQGGAARDNRLTVTGTGTASMVSVTVGYAQTGDAQGSANNNVVQVTNGGTLTSTSAGTPSYIGRNAIADTTTNGNTLTVTGTGSSWNAGNQNVTVGSAIASSTSNNNILTVSSGGTVTGINGLTLGSTTGTSTGNQLVVNGGSLTATTVTVRASNSLEIGADGGTLIGNIVNNGALNIGSTVAFSLAGNISGSGTLTQTGSGTTTLSGVNNSYSGTTTISQGSLQLGDGGTTGSLSATTGIDNNANLTVNRSDAFTQATHLNGQVITGSGSFTQAGGGTTTLSADNDYAGITTVSGGTLFINGTHSGTGLITVNSGATLGGTGTVGGAVTVSGTLSPGSSIESLGTGALTFNSGSTFAFELQTNLFDGTPGSAADLTYSSSTLDITSGAILTLTDLDTSTALTPWSKLTLISYFGDAPTGRFTYLGTPLPDGGSVTLGLNVWRFDYDDTTGGPNYAANQTGDDIRFFTMTVVPEPASAGLLLIGGLALRVLSRRRGVRRPD